MAATTVQPGAALANAPTRRGLLAGLAAAPAALALPALAAPLLPSSDWDAAAAAYWRAVETTERYDRDHHEPALARYERVRGRWPMHHDFGRDPAAKLACDTAGKAYDPYSDRHCANVNRQQDLADALIATPAPDMAALGVKGAVAAYEYDGSETPYRIVKLILDDARRLSTGAAMWPVATSEMPGNAE